MHYSDDKLVQRALEGDHDAFGVLVEKYQSQIHALAWRKIGDFHKGFTHPIMVDFRTT